MVALNYDMHVFKAAMNDYKSGNLGAEDVIKKVKPIYEKMVVEDVSQGLRNLLILKEQDVISFEYFNERQAELKEQLDCTLKFTRS